MKLSVIIPVYKVERFLTRCLDSVLRQGMHAAPTAQAFEQGEGEWEVICIDDGSPDRCPQILDDYQQRHPNLFRVVHQANAGLSPARNRGMDMARGEYVGFLDSDDYLVDGAYRYLIDHFLSQPDPAQRPDVLHFSERYVFTDGISLHDPDARPDGKLIYDGGAIDAYNKWPLPFAWTKFYKRAFLQQHRLRFPTLVCEDELFNLNVFNLNPHVTIVSCKVVCYEQSNAGSILHTKDKQRVLRQLDEFVQNIEGMHQFLDTTPPHPLHPALRRNIHNLIDIIAQKLCHIPLTRGEWQQTVAKLRGDDIRQLLLPSQGTTLLGKVSIWLKQHSLLSYPISRLTRILYRCVFDPFIKKRFVTG